MAADLQFPLTYKSESLKNLSRVAGRVLSVDAQTDEETPKA
jgi:hypothetical protein